MKIRAPAVRFSLAAVMALLLVFAVPPKVHAEGLLDSFENGVTAWGGQVEEVHVQPELEFIEDYQPTEVRNSSSVDSVLIDDESTVVDYVRNTLDVGTQVPMPGTVEKKQSIAYGKATMSFLVYQIWVSIGNQANLGHPGVFVYAAGLVFAWWGIRKAVKIVNSSWRRGHLDV